jgi:hypothetical protein
MFALGALRTKLELTKYPIFALPAPSGAMRMARPVPDIKFKELGHVLIEKAAQLLL